MKKPVSIFLSFFLFCLLPHPLQADAVPGHLPIGKVKACSCRLIKDDMSLPLVEVNNVRYICIEDIGWLGLRLEETDVFRLKAATENERKNEISRLPENETDAVSEEKPVYFVNARSHLIMINGLYYMPVDLLKAGWQMESSQDRILLKARQSDHYLVSVALYEDKIVNNGDYWLYLICQHGYWHEKTFQYITEKVILAPETSYKWIPQSKGIYLGTRILSVNGLRVPLTGQTDFEKQKPFYEAYTRARRLKELEKIFPPCLIQARMKYPVATLKEKEVVQLIRSEKHAYYWVRNASGSKCMVPFGSVEILGEQGVSGKAVTPEQIQDFAQLMHVESETSYLLWTDLGRQRTYVLIKKDGKWQHLHTFICSTGKTVSPTPSGFYKIQYGIPYFGLGKGFRCKNALVFFRDYMYHSILFDQTGQYIKSGQYELGSKASHGCIRLSEKDSSWLYHHIPVHTTVWIR